MRQLILVRHAETQANVQSRWQGQGHDGILTPRGREQMERVAGRLEAEPDVVALYASPLGRARKTAQIIGRATGLSPFLEEGLQEMDFGELDSWTMDEISTRRPNFFAAWRDAEDAELAWPGGERRSDFWQRVAASFDRILQRHPEGKVVIVAHGGSLRVGLGHLLNWPPSVINSYNLFNCSLTRLVYEYERWRILTLNDTCHLDEIA